MVKFVGGPSVSAQKSYYNHRIARPGQFRIPRAYGSVKKETKIVVRNYNYCGNSYGNYGGWQLPSWLQWFQLGANWLQNLIPQPKAPEQPTPTPEVKKKEETKPVEEQETETEVEKPDEPENIFEVESALTKNTKEVTTYVDETVPGQNLTTEINITKNPNNKDQTTGWDRIIDGYVGPDNKPASSAERRLILQYLRQELFGGDQNKFFKGGKQHVPNSIPNINGKTFTFVKDNYDNSDKWVSLGGTITSVSTESKNTESSTVKKQVTTEVPEYKGTTTVTINGETKTLKTGKAYSTPEEARADLKRQIEKHPKLTQAQKQEALANINAAKIKQE